MNGRTGNDDTGNDDSGHGEQASAGAGIIDRSMEVAEQAVYLVVGLLLVVSAFLVLGAVAWDLATTLRDGVLDAATLALDGLLLVFILVELVGAVRATIRERQLLAEPFLIVGIIASIKEIVVVALKAGSLKGDAHEEALMELVALGFVVLLLAIASYLVRRKEREPSEE